MFKKFLLIISLFTIFNQSVQTFAEIIPLKKPLQSIKEKEKKLLVDVLKPLQKPSTKKDIKNEQKQPDYKKVTKKKSNIGIILPKKKPLIAGVKKDDPVKKSKYYSKKDFALAKKALSEMKQAKWTSALKPSKKARDKSIYNFIQWRHLLTKGNKASYYEYKAFIDANEDYPRIGRIKYLAEHKLSTDPAIKGFFLGKIKSILFFFLETVFVLDISSFFSSIFFFL